MMYIGGGGLTHHWFAEQFGLFDMPEAGRRLSEEDTRLAYAQLDAMAADLPPGAQGMLFIPHLLGRACPPDPAVRGAWLGFTWTHGPGQFYRSLLEAIAYDYAQALSALRRELPAQQYDVVRVIGGGVQEHGLEPDQGRRAWPALCAPAGRRPRGTWLCNSRRARGRDLSGYGGSGTQFCAAQGYHAPARRVAHLLSRLCRGVSPRV